MAAADKVDVEFVSNIKELYRLGRVNMAAADKVDVEFVSNIKELFMKQNKKL